MLEKIVSLALGAAKSKTVWFNVLFLVVLGANEYGFADFRPDETIAVVGNILLRFLTTKAIVEK